MKHVTMELFYKSLCPDVSTKTWSCNTSKSTEENGVAAANGKARTPVRGEELYPLVCYLSADNWRMSSVRRVHYELSTVDDLDFFILNLHESCDDLLIIKWTFMPRLSLSFWPGVPSALSIWSRAVSLKSERFFYLVRYSEFRLYEVSGLYFPADSP